MRPRAEGAELDRAPVEEPARGRLLAVGEGLLLDPVYTGKSMGALLDLIDKGYFQAGENILFLHTGGTPALFPYRSEILGHISES